MKDIKHIERDFHSVAWVMHAQGVGLGVLGVIFPEYGHVTYQIEAGDE